MGRDDTGENLADTEPFGTPEDLIDDRMKGCDQHGENILGASDEAVFGDNEQ